MKKPTDQSLLFQCFGAYFHQDWNCDAETPEAVVAGYMSTETAGNMHSLGESIHSYLKEFTNDEELEEKLCNDLGCYYCPSADGLSAKDWLQNIANQLLQGKRA